MQSVRIDRKKLLLVVSDNLTKHLEEYEESIAGYKEAVLAAIDDYRAVVERAASSADIGALPYFKEPERPRCYSEQYEDLIEMLEMSVDDVIELTQAQFSQYVLDKWTWKQDFMRSTSIYNVKMK